MQAIVKFIATGCYSGCIQPFGGTWGTIPAWLIAWFFLRGDPVAIGIAIAITFVLSVWSAGEAEKTFGHDANKIVMDEWAGMMVTVIWLPPTLPWYVTAFFAFRFFDVVKIPPARQLEKLPGGWGVTMDDIVAGIQANFFLQLVIYLIAEFW